MPGSNGVAEGPAHPRIAGPGSPAALTVEMSTTGLVAVTFQGAALPGMLARYAGLMTLCGLDIVSASILPLPAQQVRHSFEAAPMDACRDSLEVMTDLERSLRSVEFGSLDIEAMLREARSREQPEPEEPTVEIDLDSEITTGIRVRATDRPGLLHDIALTITSHGLRTRSITVLTIAGVARDTFRVVDSAGSPPAAPALLDSLRRALASACG